jgi:hypothetical protein
MTDSPHLIVDAANATLSGRGWRSAHFDSHERWMVLVRYSDMLSSEQRDTIKNAPEGSVIVVQTQNGKVSAVFPITPEMMRSLPATR